MGRACAGFVVSALIQPNSVRRVSRHTAKGSSSFGLIRCGFWFDGIALALAGTDPQRWCEQIAAEAERRAA